MTESDHELIDEATPLVVDKDKLLNKKNQKRPQFQHYSSYLEKTQDSQKVAELYNTNMRERGCIFDSRCLFDRSSRESSRRSVRSLFGSQRHGISSLTEHNIHYLSTIVRTSLVTTTAARRSRRIGRTNFFGTTALVSNQ